MPTPTHIDTDVVIVGGGPVGVSLAILLAKHEVRSVVIETHTDVYPLPRAVHLDDEVARILHKIGIGEEFAAISRSAEGLRLVDRRHKSIAQFDRASVNASGIPEANFFDQPELEALLRAQLDTDGAVTTLFGHTAEGVEQSSDGVTVRSRDLDGAEVTVAGAFLVGCDGANSPVRAWLGIPSTPLGFEQRWLVIDGTCSEQLNPWDGVYQICDLDQPGTFMQIGPERYRWEFRLATDDRREDWDQARIDKLLSPWTSRAGIAPVELLRIAEYTFRALTAAQWRSGRVFVAGDAAHLTPPFVGQGLGSGLRDADNLAWKLAAVVKGSATDSLLDTYEVERKPHTVALIRKAILIGTIMTGRTLQARAVRNVMMPLAARVRPLEQQILSSVTPGLRGSQRKTPWFSGRLAGSLIPRRQIPSDDGGHQSIDDALSQAVVLVSLDGALPHHLGGLTVVRISSTGEQGERDLAAWLRKGRAEWAIVREDRTVLASGKRGAHLTLVVQAFVESLATSERIT